MSRDSRATATVASIAAAGISTGEHDGADDDAKPDGAADDDATNDDCVHTYVNGPARNYANDVTTTDTSAEDVNTTHYATTDATWPGATYAAGGPAIAAV